MKTFFIALFAAGIITFQNNLTVNSGAKQIKALQDELARLTAENIELVGSNQQLTS